MIYYGLSALLRSLGMTSGYAGPLAMALIAVDVAYVE